MAHLLPDSACYTPYEQTGVSTWLPTEEKRLAGIMIQASQQSKAVVEKKISKYLEF